MSQTYSATATIVAWFLVVCGQLVRSTETALSTTAKYSQVELDSMCSLPSVVSVLPSLWNGSTSTAIAILGPGSGCLLSEYDLTASQTSQLVLPAGTEVAFTNLDIESASNAINLVGAPQSQHNGDWFSWFANGLLQLSWLRPGSGSLVSFTNVTWYLGCDALLSYLEYLCSMDTVEGFNVEVLPSSVHVIGWNSTLLTANNVTITCTDAKSQAVPNSLQSTCRILHVDTPDSIAAALALQQESAAVSMMIIADISFVDTGNWASSLLPLSVTTNVRMVGKPTARNDLHVVDWQMRPNLLAISSVGSLSFTNLIFINEPMGTSETWGAWVFTLSWQFLRDPLDTRSVVITMVNVRQQFPLDWLSYMNQSIASWRSSDPIARARSAWISPLVVTAGPSFGPQDSAIWLVTAGPGPGRQENINTTLAPQQPSGSIQGLPYQVMETGVLDAAAAGGAMVAPGLLLPATMLYPAANSSQLLSSFTRSEANSPPANIWPSRTPSAVLLLSNITLSPSEWPSNGLTLNKSVVISSFGDNHMVVNVGNTPQWLLLGAGVKLMLRRLVLINLSVQDKSVASPYGWLSAGLWCIGYPRHTLPPPLSLVNVTLAVPWYEWVFLGCAYTSNVSGAAPGVAPWVQSVGPGSCPNWLDGSKFMYNAQGVQGVSVDDVYPELNSNSSSVNLLSLLNNYTFSNTAPDVDSDDIGGIEDWEVVLIALGCATVVLLAMGVAMLMWQRKMSQRQVGAHASAMGRLNGNKSGETEEDTGLRDRESAGTRGADATDQPWVCVPPISVAELVAKVDRAKMQEKQQENTRLVLMQEIGKGAFGKVHHGIWLGIDVAVKVMSLTNMTANQRERANREVAILLNISHPNVVTTYTYFTKEVKTPAPSASSKVLNASANGSTTDKDGSRSFTPSCVTTPHNNNPALMTSGNKSWDLLIIQEFCTSGNLRACVDTALLNQGEQHEGLPDMLRIMALATHIAQGMAHVHAKEIIHGDLNPNNVLLAKDANSCYGAVAKIADFGLAITLEGMQTHRSNLWQGTQFYVAPEVSEAGHLCKAADVYSYGIMLWELFYGTPPWYLAEMRPIANPATLLWFNEACPRSYAQLSRACMSYFQDDRPTFDEIVEQLNDMRASVLEEASACLNNVKSVQPPRGQGLKMEGGVVLIETQQSFL